MHWGLRLGYVAGWVDADADGGGGGGQRYGFFGHPPLFAVTDRFCRHALFGARGREGEREREKERERLGWIGAGWGMSLWLSGGWMNWGLT